MSKIKSNYEIISDKENNVPVTTTPYIKHGDKWLDSVVDNLDNCVNVKNFGAVGDGVTDDRPSIQLALDYARDNHITKIVIENGTFLIGWIEETITYDVPMKYGVGLVLYSGMHVVIKDASIIAKTNKYGRYHTIKIAECKDVTVEGYNAFIVGDRVTHIDDGEHLPAGQNEQGTGILVKDSERIIIKNFELSKFWGDGITISGSSCVSVSNVISDYNRRQGMSIIGSNNVITTCSKFINTDGVLPRSGVDVEPDNLDESYDITFIDCEFIGNKGHGLLVTATSYGINAINCKFEGNTYNSAVYTDSTTVIPHDVVYDNCIFYKSGYGGLRIKNAKNIIVRNCNFNEKTFCIQQIGDVSENLIVDGCTMTLETKATYGMTAVNAHIINNNFVDIICDTSDTARPDSAAIYSYNPHLMRIEGNVFRGCTRGVRFSGNTSRVNKYLVIKGNTVEFTDTKASGVGILVRRCDNVRIESNTIIHHNDNDKTIAIGFDEATGAYIFDNIAEFDNDLGHFLERYQSKSMVIRYIDGRYVIIGPDGLIVETEKPEE